MKTVSLIPHPATPVAFELRLAAAVSRSEDGKAISVQYTMRGDLKHVRIPDADDGRRQDGLWRHTCFEAFFRGALGEGYVEMNFSPSTEWAAYRFTAYRHGMAPLPVDAPPRVDVDRAEDCVTLRADWPLSALRAMLPHGPYALALSAVVETAAGGHHYWALAHPPGKPDFHHNAGFVMSLEGIIP